MPTNDERREVAARLREARANLESIPVPRDIDQASFTYLVELTKAIGDDGHIFNRLADLIEPEPERMCELEQPKSGKRRCKRCGAFVSVDAICDCFGIIQTRYCPNCGAKVT